MVEHFDRQGIVELRDGIHNDPDFPPMMQVEDRGGDDLSPEERRLTDIGMRRLLIVGTPRE